MNAHKIFVLVISSIFISCILDSCKGKSAGAGGTINVHINAEPDMLNPLNKASSNATRIVDLMFSGLLNINPAGNYENVPCLLKENAKITEITDGPLKGGMKLDFEIKKDAVWDNGTPIDGNDYLFTMKAILNPNTNCVALKSYYDWVADIEIDSLNPKKFTVYSNKKYYRIEELASGYVLPEYNYDSLKLMRKFSIKDLVNLKKHAELVVDKDIITFSTEFNSEKFQRDANYIVGSGPYKLDHWTTGQEVVLKRKENWWGDKYKDERVFYAFPKTIKINIIPDNNTAFTALKGNQLDVLTGISAKNFNELEANTEFLKKYDLEKIEKFGYSYIGINLRNPKFEDLKVRQALAHAIDRDKINKIIYLGQATKTESFIHSKQVHYNKNLIPFEFSLEKASKLLNESGWKDSDGDGILDKIINGKKTPFSIEIKYPKDEPTKNTILIIQEDLNKIGVELQLVEKEMTMLSDDLKKQQFEIYLFGMTINPTMSDPKQQWHTSSAVAGGSNNVGWGNETSDQLIETLISELDKEKRIKLYMELQQKIHYDVPVIFLFNPKNRIATSKKFEVEKTLISPGVLFNEFKLK